MNTLREAAQQALKAMEIAEVDPHSSDAVYKAIAALRAALAEPVQGDVCEHHTPVDLPCDKCHADELTVVYMMGAQSRLRTLTDEVIADLWYKNGTHHHHFARAIERWIKGTDKY